MKYKLGEICSFQSGGTPSKTNAAYFSGDIPWITTVALNGQVIGKQAAVDWITKKAIAESAAKIVPARSIMIGTRVGVGKVAINESPMSTSQDIISLVGIDESLWSKEFLCRFIQAKESYLKSQARGATIKGIKIDVLASLDLPDVSIDSQQEIVAVLDKIQNILAARRSQLSALDNLIKARFVEMFGTANNNLFGFQVETLDNVAEVIFAGGDKPADCSVERDNEHLYPVYANGYEEEGLQGYSSKCRVKKPAVTVSARGTIGYCFIRKAGFTPVVRLVTIVPNDKVSVSYLKYAIDTMDIKSSGTSQAQLTVPEFRKEKIIVPSMELQEQFSGFVAQIDKSKSVIQKSLDETQLLFDSLMQKYFG